MSERAVIERCLEALHDVEWMSSSGFGPECPWCDGIEPGTLDGDPNRANILSGGRREGHSDECRVRRAIVAASLWLELGP